MAIKEQKPIYQSMPETDTLFKLAAVQPNVLGKTTVTWVQSDPLNSPKNTQRFCDEVGGVD